MKSMYSLVKPNISLYKLFLHNLSKCINTDIIIETVNSYCNINKIVKYTLAQI